MILHRTLFIIPIFLIGIASAQKPDTYVAVHCEPTHTYYYPSLIKMVALADSFDAFLTIEFNPQWADTFLANPSLLNEVRQWQKDGHEIAAHHHGVSYGAGGWDGFTNRPPAEYPVPSRYSGDMQDYFALLSQLAGDSFLFTAGIPDTVDWPVGIPFRTEGHSLTEALMRPTSITLNGQQVTGLGYGLINTRQKVDSAKVLFNSAGSLDVLGVVLHESNFKEDPTNLRAWLQFLKIKNTRVKTVRQIMRERGIKTGIQNSRTDRPLLSPERIVLHPNYPNPFNASTIVRFSVERTDRVRLEVMDLSGRLVRTLADRVFDPGVHQVLFESGGTPSGMYLTVLQSDGLRQVRKILLVR